MKKPRVLFICGSAPWPRNGGAMLRNYYMIAALSRAYCVDVVVADQPDEAVPAAFASMVDDYAAFPRTANARGGFGRIARLAGRHQSTLTAGWTSPALRDYVAERLGRYPYAAIQVDLPMYDALPRRNAIPIVYNAHNCEAALQMRRAAVEKPHIAAALTLDAVRVRQLEKTLVERATFVAACSLSDVVDFERFVPAIREKVAVIPNGVDVGMYASVRQLPADPDTVLITGSMDWRPNRLGLRWFLRKALPRLRERHPTVRVRIAGRMQADLVAELTTYAGVEVIPNPPSMTSVLAAASVVAAPIIASSGTRLRILEAWAAGRPVVTTTAGAFGLDCETGRDLMVRDDPEKFADALVTLLRAGSIRRMLAENAQVRVQKYDWHAIGTKLVKAYQEEIDHITPSIRTVRGDVTLVAGV